MIFSINNFHEIEELYLKGIFNGNEEDKFFNLVKTEPITNIFKTNNQKKILKLIKNLNKKQLNS